MCLIDGSTSETDSLSIQEGRRREREKTTPKLFPLLMIPSAGHLRLINQKKIFGEASEQAVHGFAWDTLITIRNLYEVRRLLKRERKRG